MALKKKALFSFSVAVVLLLLLAVVSSVAGLRFDSTYSYHVLDKDVAQHVTTDFRVRTITQLIPCIPSTLVSGAGYQTNTAAGMKESSAPMVPFSCQIHAVYFRGWPIWPHHKPSP